MSSTLFLPSLLFHDGSFSGLYRNPIDEVARFNKYRDVDGVRWPFQIVRERNGEKVSEIFAETVTINSGLTDQLFTLPASVKILKKAK